MKTRLRKHTASLAKTMIGLRDSSSLLLALFLSAFFLQGCEPPQSPGGGGAPGGMPGRPANTSKPMTNRTNAPTAVAPTTPGKKPDDTTNPIAPKAEPQKLLGTSEKIEIAGNTLELASTIIAANTNPFLNRLPKIVVAATPEQPTEIPADPFAGISILGIIFNPKQPMALISENGEPAVIKKAGEVLGSGGIQVMRISQKDIILQQVGVSKQQRTLTLPDIVGYAAGDKGEGNTNINGSSDSAPKDHGNPKARFKNINRLSEPQPAKKDGADVTLQEP
jgi:hypothetical protein